MSEYGGYSRMLSQHLGKCLTEEQRTRWVEPKFEVKIGALS